MASSSVTRSFVETPGAAGLNRTIWPGFSVPVPMVAAQSQSGGGVIAGGTFSTTGHMQLISVAVSASASSANSMMSVKVSVDDASLGSLEFFASSASSKLVLTPRRFLAFLRSGAHTVTLTAGSGTATGTVDRAMVSVIDLGDNPELLRSFTHVYGPYKDVPFFTRGGTVLLWVAGSGRSKTASQLTGASIQVDGAEVAQLQVFANAAETRLELVPAQVLRTNLDPGDHTLRVVPTSATTIDANDRWAVEILELTAPPQVLSVSSPIQNVACINQNGGQTVASGTFSTSGGLVLLRAMASAWARASSSPLNLTVRVDGVSSGTVSGYTSAGTFHMPLVPADILLTSLAPGSHQVALIADPATVTDGNDRCSVSILELARTMPK